MAGTIAQLIGAVLGMALFGALMALIVRKIFGIALGTSYLIGLAIFTPFAVWSYAYNYPGETWLDGAFLYVPAAVAAYFALMATARKQGELNGEDAPRVNWGGLWRVLGWVMFVILAALGSTFIFSAFRAQFDAALPFLIGSTLLICAFLLWRKLTARPPYPHPSNNPLQSKTENK